MKSARMVHMVYGPQGAGKSTFAAQLSAQTGAAVFGIDDWMLGLFMEDLPEQMSLEWISGRTQRCERVIWSVCLQLLGLGTDVVLDLGLMRREDRQRVRQLAQDAGFLVRVHLIDAEQDVRRQRVLARNSERGETFSFVVTPEMFGFMETVYEAPDAVELAHSETVEA